MSFTGTLEKCKACQKTVYVVDMITADGIPYHKTCFKCSHCNGKLMVGRYSFMDGMLFCMPHFEQRFKETGTYSKQPYTCMKTEVNKTPSKHSSMFSGTLDKCAVCKKTAYPLEKLIVEGQNYHKSCFRCAKGGCSLMASNYAALDGILYCMPHFAQLFKEKGSYDHINESILVKKDDDNTASLDENKDEIAPDVEVKQEEESELAQVE